MIPLRDDNPTTGFPIVTYSLIAINVVVFLVQLTMPQRQLSQIYITQSVVPVLVSRAPFALDNLLDFIRSMFFHGGWAHLLGNMLYLFIFGDNIEDRMGKIPYVVFYLICGFVAGYAQVLIDPTSQIPLIGASGAIAGVLGAYLVLFPNASVKTLITLGYFMRAIDIRALYVLGFWFVLQLFNGVASISPSSGSDAGVAFFAHIGGFVAGAVLIWIFKTLFPRPIDAAMF